MRHAGARAFAVASTIVNRVLRGLREVPLT